jgi:maleylpyruvate isomerase
MQLYSYFRSSAAYRLRIALVLKGVGYEQITVNLMKGEQQSPEYLAVNRQGLVPVLKLNDSQLLVQSGAILDWLDENFPTPALYPTDSVERAGVRGMCHIISFDIHPINNLRVLKYLNNELGISEEQKTQWYQHWIEFGLEALEAQINATTYTSCGSVSMLDIYLVPQVYNALRFKQDMARFPKILVVYNACNELNIFKKQHQKCNLMPIKYLPGVLF